MFHPDFEFQWMSRNCASNAPPSTSAPIDILHRVSSSVYIIYEHLFDSLPVQAPITSSQYLASTLLSSTERPSQTRRILPRFFAEF